MSAGVRRLLAMRSSRLGAIALLALASACASGAAAGGGGASGDLQIVHVALRDFSITPMGEVHAGRVRLHVANEGQSPHTLAIQVAGAPSVTKLIQPADYDTLEFPNLAAGTYTMWCTVGGHREAGMEGTLTVAAPNAPARPSTEAPLDIDAAHAAGIKAFPAKTQGTGGQVLRPKIVDGVKVFELTARAVRWEVTPGTFVDAFGYNGQVPGPEIRVRQGDRVRVNFFNQLDESTTVHFHGVTVPNAMDGVPFITQPPVTPGHSFIYEFTVVDEPGTYMYHSHHNATIQVGKGLLGAFVVEPETKNWDVENTMVVGDGPLGFTINGKGFPATAPIVAKLNQRVLVRLLNEGQLLHPMHLHGFHFTVIGRDGHKVPVPYDVDTLVIAPGERYDVLFKATLPGTWAFHCHILSHAESEHGMHGMVTAVIVK
jgi:manganese oxidase